MGEGGRRKRGEGGERGKGAKKDGVGVHCTGLGYERVYEGGSGVP